MTTITVVNDAAERGVKLAQDFWENSKSEESYQNVIRVVELERKKQPNQRKKISRYILLLYFAENFCYIDLVFF